MSDVVAAVDQVYILGVNHHREFLIDNFVFPD